LIAQLFDPVGGVVNGRQTCTGHIEIKFHPKHFANSVVIYQWCPQIISNPKD